MNDLISRQSAIDAVEKAKTARSEDGEIFCAKINAQMNIQLLPSIQPTIDAVEVVRCKDCKHMKYAIDKAKNGICAALGALIIMNGNDYCSYGERKEE